MENFSDVELFMFALSAHILGADSQVKCPLVTEVAKRQLLQELAAVARHIRVLVIDKDKYQDYDRLTMEERMYFDGCPSR